MSTAQVANINRVGRETRTAREAAEQFAEQEFRIKRTETDRLQQQVKLQKDRIQANLDLAELRGDVSLEIAGGTRADTQARFDAGRPQREALTAESIARTRVMLRGLKEGNDLERRFGELLEDVFLKGPDLFDPEIDGTAIATLLIQQGASHVEVNKILESRGIPPIPIPDAPDAINIDAAGLEATRELIRKGIN